MEMPWPGDANLIAAGISHTFVDYGDGGTWALGCCCKHDQTCACKRN